MAASTVQVAVWVSMFTRKDVQRGSTSYQGSDVKSERSLGEMMEKSSLGKGLDFMMRSRRGNWLCEHGRELDSEVREVMDFIGRRFLAGRLKALQLGSPRELARRRTGKH